MSGTSHFKSNPNTDFRDIDHISKAEAEAEAKALRKGIDYHDLRYYLKNDPVISDAVYDALFHRLQVIEDHFPELRTENSPTRRVGAEPASRLPKVRHRADMLSLASALEEKKVREFIAFVHRESDGKTIRFTLEPKYDGLSVELVYKKGELSVVTTRGDGETGEDITRNIRTIRSVPLRLQGKAQLPSLLAVRGEVYMTAKGFQDLNQQKVQNDEEPFANARNAAAGLVRQLDPKKVADKPLEIVVYDIMAIEGLDIATQQDAVKQMQHWGFKTGAHIRTATGFEEVKHYYQQMADQREALDFDIDGVVIKLNSFEQRRSLGTRQRTPRWAFAWKFAPKEELTTLQRIVVQVGRTGKLTPVALLEPVDVSGVTVSRATLHNAGEAAKKDVRPGDKVRIARAGDVIPEVVERVNTPGRKRNPSFHMPDDCPACGARIVREGAYHLCPASLSCPPQVIGTVRHYGSRDAADIDGLGRKTDEALYHKDLIRDIADLYRLSVEDIKTLEGFAETSARQLYDAVRRRSTLPLHRFLYALGIRHVGRSAARILAHHFTSFSNIREAAESELKTVDEIGPEIAASVHQFFNRRENQRVLQKMFEAGVTIEDAPKREDTQTLKDKSFVFTGRLTHYTRREAQDAVERLGGNATSSVSGRTDYLVVGENPGTKYDEAQENDVTIIDEDALREMIGDA